MVIGWNRKFMTCKLNRRPTPQIILSFTFSMHWEYWSPSTIWKNEASIYFVLHPLCLMRTENYGPWIYIEDTGTKFYCPSPSVPHRRNGKFQPFKQHRGTRHHGVACRGPHMQTACSHAETGWYISRSRPIQIWVKGHWPWLLIVWWFEFDSL